MSRAYLLQRYVSACAGRGQLAIKFNGSIFTVPEPGRQGDADYRRWGPGYWWQNTRLPYLSMPAAGDFEMMPPLFNQYFEMLPLCTNRVRKYFGHGGAYYPECICFWGDVFLETYGWESWKTRENKLQKSGWHKYEWVSGLELAYMMLEYYTYTEDAGFLNTKALPLAIEVLTFFNEHYMTGADGKLFMNPSQALETWWDCDNPMPELAGMYAVIAQLERLPENALTADRKRNIENPDQCHGGVLTKGIQSLVMQCDGKRIDLFPAFPADWDCDFKLHAPYNTIVEGQLKNGKITALKVTPEERRKDVVIIN